MKKILLLIPLVTILVFPSLVFAQDATKSTRTRVDVIDEVRDIRQSVVEKRQEVRSEVREKREELRTRVQEKREETRKKIAEKRAERIREFIKRMKTRLEAQAGRLDKLVGRIEERLTILGKTQDVSAIQAKVDDAKGKLASAKEDIAALDGVADDLLNSDDPKASFETVREMVKSIKDQLVEVHRLLVSVIGDIKGLRVGTTKGE